MGSIPACTGEPEPPSRTATPNQVYPRVYGGTFYNTGKERIETGLSPRVRGNHFFGVHSLGQVGSIPACTGEPGWWRTCAPSGGVYPRVYGGTWIEMEEKTGKRGLSPRVRGNRRRRAARDLDVRSIPACTGEPGKRGIFPCRCGVYPRVYGGTCEAATTVSTRSGLSPRVRGNLVRELRQDANDRSIPACTGEPVTVVQIKRTVRVYPRVYGGTRIHGVGQNH